MVILIFAIAGYSLHKKLYEWGWTEKAPVPGFILGESELKQANQSAVEARATETAPSSASNAKDSFLWPHPERKNVWCATLKPFRGAEEPGSAWDVYEEAIKLGLITAGEVDRYLVYRNGYKEGVVPDVNMLHGDPRSHYLQPGDDACVGIVN